ncbi:hypothetical protein Taro_026930 [Colocasia esculenta]|uniref:Uncharacterized protein n=1 Tax=Colocasia esculenta TaxID=4460 RepID=A0A843VL11_COLES|nr:hypothetical protein [Colocasia esculenta]
MQRGGASRQPPCRDGKPGCDSDPYRDRQPRRDKVAPDRGDASTDVATRMNTSSLLHDAETPRTALLLA